VIKTLSHYRKEYVNQATSGNLFLNCLSSSFHFCSCFCCECFPFSATPSVSETQFEQCNWYGFAQRQWDQVLR